MVSALDGYVSDPCYPELAAIIMAGVLHVIVEINVSEAAAWLYNLAVSLAVIVYLVWRVKRTDGVLRIWGIRCDNFWPALWAQLSFGAIGALVLIGFGAVSDDLRLPGTYWLTVVLYPIWGTAQQFALQNFIARNLAGLLPNPVAMAVAASALFGASHYPRLDLVLLTFIAGVLFTLIYHRIPNLWAVGIVHGILGSLAVYIVLQEDPGAAIMGYLSGR